ncbi:class I SAM-dependent methyltransferase [Plantactinospora sp. KBS50]|uniref:class I SAM-dependent methyltransferase n=1 Tax=Plantactinospora sp. KBS50 TaxID=2024580 RepID=UPI000BAA99D4|nr:class I SAM-dependent methyltransferase [Plantactinospora sp. KBS50]ASW56910.1 SAM-dependent methyltransferase [Plantactinospora sp. KBS50]
MDVTEFRRALVRFSDRFVELVSKYDGTTRHAAELESVIGDYSSFVTDERNQEPWARLEGGGTAEFAVLVDDLRVRSAQCAAIIEKYRALNLLNGRAETDSYFENVESCIEEEFRMCRITSSSRVLLVGCGSFPMTPLHIATRTGAQVVGVDIDAEAVELGRRVLDMLGRDLDIRLENTPVEELAFTAHASHIIFSSTVRAKYDLLSAVHARTRDDVIVAIRYGDHLKSLFNYPMLEVDRTDWRLVERILRPDQIFDIARYAKV